MVTKDKQRTFSLRYEQLVANATPAELAVKRALDSLGIRYKFQKGFLKGSTVRLVDFWVRSPYRLILEIDGPCHSPARDQYREQQIQAQRVHKPKFIRVTNDWVFEQPDLPAALKSLLDNVKGR